MIHNPVIPIVVGNDFAVVTGARPNFITADNGGVVVIKHGAALLVHIGASQLGAAAHHGTIGGVLALATASHAGKEVIVAATFVDHGALEGTTCNLGLLVEVLYLKTVFGQLRNVNVMETAPNQIFLVTLFHIAGVDTVLHTDFLASEHLAHIREFFRACAFGHTDTGLGGIAPKRKGIIHQVLPVHVIHIRGPYRIAAAIPGRGGEHSAQIAPGDQVL